MRNTIFSRILIFSALFISLSTGSVLAENFVVNQEGDAACYVGATSCDIDSIEAGDQCTLTCAIERSNVDSGADVITFDPDFNQGNYSINANSGMPDIVSPVEIDGQGALVTIYGNTSDSNYGFDFKNNRTSFKSSFSIEIFNV